MPELPEAETITRQVHGHLAGRQLGKVIDFRADVIRNNQQKPPRWLQHSKVERVSRRGKRIVISLESERGIIVYLGMTGQLEVQATKDPVRPHTHMRIGIAGCDLELRFADARRFGGIRFFESEGGAEPEGLAELGIEPLEMTAKEFRLHMRRNRRIKAVLMDQKVIAGLGNIYCDEALFRAGIHPLEVANEVDDRRIGLLCRAIKHILKKAIDAKGSTIQSYQHAEGAGTFQSQHQVYGREGEQCRKCLTAVERIAVSGRSTHYCPQCQPLNRSDQK